MSGLTGLLKRTGLLRTSGAHVPHRKNTEDMETVKMPYPDEVMIPMQMHIGAPCIPLVKKGDHVDIGTKIGENEKGMCAPIHASISGTVDRIDTIRLPGGQACQAVVIKSDGQATMDKDLKAPEVHSREDLIKAIRESGLVGLGGAGFPTYVKLNPSPEVRDGIDTLIINGAECEPYLTSDYRQILEDPVMIMRGVYEVSALMEVKECIIAIEDNKPEAIRILDEIAKLDDE
ncbi:MAG: electron transport complex subunit RsxC, partial [Lachnospiraceae bacterium]|nr:electron transport complex subunit RsxC [Lachnospiraceae bacterium]